MSGPPPRRRFAGLIETSGMQDAATKARREARRRRHRSDARYLDSIIERALRTPRTTPSDHT